MSPVKLGRQLKRKMEEEIPAGKHFTREYPKANKGRERRSAS